MALKSGVIFSRFFFKLYVRLFIAKFIDEKFIKREEYPMNENEHDRTSSKGDFRTSLNNVNNSGSRERYLLSSAPGGIDAEYAWQFAGGDGQGKIKFVDIEQGWIMNHEYLEIRTLPSTGISDPRFEDHGTAVLGIIMMKNNESGGTGITPKANGYVISTWRPSLTYDIPNAIHYAISCLDFGDIILLEEQVYGKEPQTCFLPAEVEHEVYKAILEATKSGIVVIEPAGNGVIVSEKGVNLDAIVRDERNILNKSSAHFRDSGAIMVAASNSKPPFERLYRSNFGSRIDCFAWGEDVRTAGNFPGSSNGLKNRFTNSFCGTSSAAAIVAGIAMAVQSIVEASYHERLSPIQLRNILGDENFGTCSALGLAKDKIGVMPDLKKIIDQALPIYFGSPAKMKK
jgi:subtilisin family serine protease